MTNERFRSVKQMLLSEDVENNVMALIILDAQHFQENLAFILFAMKYSRNSREVWLENAPQICKKISLIDGFDFDTTLTFKKILEVLMFMKAPYEQIEFTLIVFGDHLKEQMVILGYDFIEDIDITIKLNKEYEKQRQHRESVESN